MQKKSANFEEKLAFLLFTGEGTYCLRERQTSPERSGGVITQAAGAAEYEFSC